VEISHDSTH